MTRRIRLAVHQSKPQLEVAASVEQAVAAIREVAGSCTSSTMLLFSELFLGGYGAGAALLSDMVAIVLPQSPDDRGYQGAYILEPIRGACRHFGVAVVMGFVEKDSANGLFYNSSVAIGCDGEILATYRKIHLWGAYETQLFTPGSDFKSGIFDFCGVRCGMLVCFDVEFPESVRTLRLLGCEVVLVPTALVNSFNARVTVPSRAFENNVVVCYANNVGQDIWMSEVLYCGLSVVALPDGNEGVRLGETSTSVGICDIDIDSDEIKAAHARNNYIACRRSDLYLR